MPILLTLMSAYGQLRIEKKLVYRQQADEAFEVMSKTIETFSRRLLFRPFEDFVFTAPQPPALASQLASGSARHEDNALGCFQRAPNLTFAVAGQKDGRYFEHLLETAPASPSSGFAGTIQVVSSEPDLKILEGKLSSLSLYRDGKGAMLLVRHIAMSRGDWLQGCSFDERTLLSDEFAREFGSMAVARRLALEIHSPSGIIDVRNSLPPERRKRLEAGERVDVTRRPLPAPFQIYEAAFVTDHLPLSGSYGGAVILELLTGMLAFLLPLAFTAIYWAGSRVIREAETRAAFSAAVSHELRTPLTAMKMHLEMLLSGMVASEEKRGEYLRRISDQTDRLIRLVTGALDASGLERTAPADLQRTSVEDAVSL
jgi:hypothetical protein